MASVTLTLSSRKKENGIWGEILSCARTRKLVEELVRSEGLWLEETLFGNWGQGYPLGVGVKGQCENGCEGVKRALKSGKSGRNECGKKRNEGGERLGTVDEEKQQKNPVAI